MRSPVGFRKACVVTTVTVCGFIIIASTFLHQAPPDQLLEMNSRRDGGVGLSRKLQSIRTNWENGISKVHMTAQEASQIMWQLWIEDGNHVSIGTVYNTCDVDQRIAVGKLTLEPDPQHGGVKAILHLNITFDYTVTSGWAYFTAFYKNQQLYSNRWNLCTVDDDQEITCPMNKGIFNIVKHIPISTLLPQGYYHVDAYITDQHDKTQLCFDISLTL